MTRDREGIEYTNQSLLIEDKSHSSCLKEKRKHQLAFVFLKIDSMTKNLLYRLAMQELDPIDNYVDKVVEKRAILTMKGIGA